MQNSYEDDFKKRFLSFLEKKDQYITQGRGNQLIFKNIRLSNHSKSFNIIIYDHSYNGSLESYFFCINKVKKPCILLCTQIGEINNIREKYISLKNYLLEADNIEKVICISSEDSNTSMYENKLVFLEVFQESNNNQSKFLVYQNKEMGLKDLVNSIIEINKKDINIIIKGSNSMHMEQLISNFIELIGLYN